MEAMNVLHGDREGFDVVDVRRRKQELVARRNVRRVWMGERDMHQGQSFARLLEVEIG